MIYDSVHFSDRFMLTLAHFSVGSRTDTESMFEGLPSNARNGLSVSAINKGGELVKSGHNGL
ncbi:MAG: hypothetical protein JWM68_5326 [Verrucomicrobiales bacterium]|nr:hypothetical protein [Verrucomicrobiales bacterium]